MPIRDLEFPLKTQDRGAALEELLEQVASGDCRAFTALYERTAARVLGLCRRLVVDRATAEDLTQEVFLEVWTKAARFDRTKGSVIGWILHIAHHRAVDRIRTTESARRRDTTDASFHQHRFDVQADHRIVRACDAQQLWAAIDALSHLRREALLYAYFTNHNHQQASELLQIPLGTFKSRVRDAVGALRPLLAGIR